MGATYIVHSNVWIILEQHFLPMTNRLTLDQYLINPILDHLKVGIGVPNRELLEMLVGAFVRTVPWESAFRIVRRAQCAELESCPRWPEEFWHLHLQDGSGGSCFETNFAFFALLISLGFDGYLTINNMGESKGCHTAIIILFGKQKWLVDVGFPLYTILPINNYGTVFRSSPYLHYTIRPLGGMFFQIERRPHPKWYAFTLLDKPVSEEQYRLATTADYGPNGHFLDRVIIHKVIDDVLWRFNSDQSPYCLEYFKDGRQYEQFLHGDTAKTISQKFEMKEKVIRQALAVIKTQIGEKGPKR